MTQLVLRSGDIPFDLMPPVYRYALYPYLADVGHGELWICKTRLKDKWGTPRYRAILLWAENKNSAARIIFDDNTLARWEVPDEVAAAALSYFCVTKDAVDAEYFKNYTTNQIYFRDFHADSVGMLAYADEYDEGKSLSHLLINKEYGGNPRSRN